jgi:hypothetical protein
LVQGRQLYALHGLHREFRQLSEGQAHPLQQKFMRRAGTLVHPQVQRGQDPRQSLV